MTSTRDVGAGVQHQVSTSIHVLVNCRIGDKKVKTKMWDDRVSGWGAGENKKAGLGQAEAAVYVVYGLCSIVYACVSMSMSE